MTHHLFGPLSGRRDWQLCPGCNFRFGRAESGMEMLGACRKCGHRYDLTCDECGAVMRDLAVRYEMSSGKPHTITACPNQDRRGLHSVVKVAAPKKRALSRWHAISYYFDTNATHECASCGRVVSHDECHVDHVVPLSRGGADIIDNTQILCVSCHDRKTASEFPSWRRG